VIQIRVLNQPDLDVQLRVAPDGTISVPYVGRFRAAGLTEDVIAARIRKALTSVGILK
jgi:protein involved in polysaccharide export with SLBB domain